MGSFMLAPAFPRRARAIRLDNARPTAAARVEHISGNEDRDPKSSRPRQVRHRPIYRKRPAAEAMCPDFSCSLAQGARRFLDIVHGIASCHLRPQELTLYFGLPDFA